MENDRETRELLHDSIENVECQWGRNEAASLGVNGALLAGELISTVRSTDRDSERVATGAGSKIYHLFRLGVMAFCSTYFVFYTSEHTELSLYRYVELMSIFYYFLGEGDVLLIRQVRTINHYRRETEINAALAGLEAVTMIQMKNNLGMLPTEFFSVLYCTLSHVAEKGLVSILTSTLGYLKNNRTLGSSRSRNDCLELLHVVEIEGRNSIAALDCLCKHLAGVYKTEFFEVYHFFTYFNTNKIYCSHAAKINQRANLTVLRCKITLFF